MKWVLAVLAAISLAPVARVFPAEPGARTGAAPAWSVTGRVFREDGKTPYPGAEVELRALERPHVGGRALRTQSDEAGFFAFRSLQWATYSLSVSAPGWSGYVSGLFSLRPGADHVFLEAVMEPLERGQPAGRFTARILGPDGAPVAWKRVRYTLQGIGPGRAWDNGMLIPPHEIRMGDLVYRRFGPWDERTDTEGTVRITVAPGRYSAKLQVAGFADLAQTVTVPAGPVGQVATYRLQPDPEADVPKEDAPPQRPPSPGVGPAPKGDLTGTLVGPDGAPLAGATVSLWIRGRESPDLPYEGRGGFVPPDVKTNARGAFAVQRVSAGAVTVVAKVPGFRESDPVQVVVPAGGTADVVLRLPGPSLRAGGRVTTPEGVAVPNAFVYAHRPIEPGTRDVWSAVPGQTLAPHLPGSGDGLWMVTADTQGRFTFTDLDEGEYTFAATAPGYTRDAYRGVLLRAAGPAPDVLLELEPSGTVEGTVVRADGTPATGEMAHFALDETRLSARIGPEGRFCLRDIPPGPYKLSYQLPHSFGHWGPTITVPAGGTARGVDLRLEAGLSLGGRVLQAGGQPAAWTQIGWTQRTPDGVRQVPWVTDEEGRFTLTGLAAGAAELWVHPPGLPSVGRDVRLPTSDVLEIRLPAGVPVRGTVRDRDGKPLPDAVVYSRRLGMPQGDSTVRTDALGRYRLVCAGPGRVLLGVSHEGHRPLRVSHALPPEGATLDLTLEPLSMTVVRGRVLMPDGRPAWGVHVYGVTDSRGWVAAVSTDHEGAFRWERCPIGRIGIEVRGGDAWGQRVPVEVLPGQETVVPDIRLTATGVIAGRVHGSEPAPTRTTRVLKVSPEAVDGAGRPVPPKGGVRLYPPEGGWDGPLPSQRLPAGRDASCFFRTIGGEVCTVYPEGTRFPETPSEGSGVIPNRDGTFRLAQVPVGRVSVQTGWTRGPLQSALRPGVSVEVKPGVTASVEVPAVMSGSLRGRVTRQPGSLPEAAALELYHRETLERAGVAGADTEGSFSLEGLAPGEYVAYLWQRSLAPAKQAFRIEAWQTTELAIPMQPGVSLSGRVVARGAGTVYVSAESDTSFGGARVEEDGSFTFEHLLPGTYTLHVWSPGREGIAETRDVRVGENGAEGVTLTGP